MSTPQAPTGGPQNDALNEALDEALTEAAMNEAMTDALTDAMLDGGMTGDSVMIQEEELLLEPDETSGDTLSTLRTIGLVGVGLVATGGAAYLAVRVLRDRGLLSGIAMPRLRGARRGMRVDVRPRTLVFSPTLTISLPFSSIVQQRGRGRGIPNLTVANPMTSLGDSLTSVRTLGSRLSDRLPWTRSDDEELLDC